VPTYQYSCTDCGHFFEAVQSFSDDSLTECPVCGGKLRKVFNAVGVVFKGSGFYRNDSRGTSTSASPATASTTSTPSSSSSSTSSSSDSGSSGSGSSSAAAAS
jgi:putative FmdB family regulatory protein